MALRIRSVIFKSYCSSSNPVTSIRFLICYFLLLKFVVCEFVIVTIIFEIYFVWIGLLLLSDLEKLDVWICSYYYQIWDLLCVLIVFVFEYLLCVKFVLNKICMYSALFSYQRYAIFVYWFLDLLSAFINYWFEKIFDTSFLKRLLGFRKSGTYWYTVG